MKTNVLEPQTYILIFIFSLLYIAIWIIKRIRKHKNRKNIKKLAKKVKEMTPENFFKLRNHKIDGGVQYSTAHNFSGVYILYNKTKRMYYIGQAKHIFDRVNSHLTGKGNGDVYADYKHGDKFTIRLIDLEDSGFLNLNDMERQAIAAYNAYTNGYNKTKGNK